MVSGAVDDTFIWLRARPDRSRADLRTTPSSRWAAVARSVFPTFAGSCCLPCSQAGSAAMTTVQTSSQTAMGSQPINPAATTAG